MRLISWLGGIVIAAAIASTVGALAASPHRSDHSHALAPAPLPLATEICCSNDSTVAPPHHPYHPPPSPTPSPTPQAAPPAPVAQAAPPAHFALVVNSTQQALINQDRARNGLTPLTWNGCLYNVAAAQAAHIATPGVAFQHYGGVQQDLGCHLGVQVGENIGWYSLGPNDSWMNAKFVASPDHYANIMGPYHYVATAWVVAPNGYGYIAVEFG